MLDWLYTALSWVLLRWHDLFSSFLEPAGGITWALSIMFLVVTIRLLLFPLFVKQIKSQRAMQELQPEIAKLRKQYGSDRQGMAQAQQAMFKERGVNPLAGCLPILPQIPVFFALFHVLRWITPIPDDLDAEDEQYFSQYSWTPELVDQAAIAKLFGAPISASFNMAGEKADAILGLDGVTQGGIRLVAVVLIVIMCITTFFTQKQIMRRSGPVEGQAAMVQKLLLYGMPASLFVTGFFFPIGVLLYWVTNNAWTFGQQFFILRKMPPPGSAAAKAKAAAEKPAIDPKTLAPKPGAKPVRSKPGRPATPPAGGPSSQASRPAGTGGGTGAGDAAGAGPGGAGGTSAGGTGGGSSGSSGANGQPPPSARRSGSRPSGKGGSAPANRGKRKRR